MDQEQPIATLRVHLFGSLKITWADQGVDLSRRQTRALFCRLAAALKPLSRDYLCFLFWPDQPDTVARRNLTKVLTHLRRALPQPDLLVVSSVDVRLDPQRVWSDAATFVQQGCLSPTIETLQTSVNLYRGAFLDGFILADSPEFESWAGHQRQFFEQHYLQALARLIDLTATAPDYHTAITYAQRYLAHDDLAETIHRRLIECYAASGDRGAALRQYETCVAVLERELGVDPLPETRAAYMAALSYQPPPVHQGSPALVWSTLPGFDTTLVGRAHTLAQLSQSFDKVRQGQGQVVLITGEAGVGKSRLLQEFAQQVACEAIVLAGTEQPTEQTLPYHAITQALRHGIYLAGITLTIEPIWLAEASLLLPELRTLYPDLAQPLPTDPAQARTRLFEALCRLLLAIAAGERPVLLCLDDLHWADSATLDWLSFLGQRVRNQRLLVIGTYRSEEPDQLRVVRQGCGRLGILTEIELDGLAVPAIGQILQQVDKSGSDHAHLTRRLHQTTGGNAFFLFEILQAFTESGKSVDVLANAPDIPLSQTVTDTVMRRFRRLRPMAQQVLEASAVLGLEFSYALINHTAGRGEMETMDGLDELVKRRLLKEQTDSYCFHHDITRRVIYQSLSHGRRRLLHRRAGETLEAIHTAELDAVSGQIARHYEEGGSLAQALRFYQQAAAVAVRMFANAEAMAHLQRAIGLLPMAQQDHRRIAQLYEALADTFVIMGQHAMARLNYTKTQEFIPQSDIVWQTQLKIKIGDACSAVQNYLEALAFYQEADDLLQTASLSTESITASTRGQTWFRLQFARVEVYYFLNDLAAMSTLLTDLQKPIQQQAILANEIAYYYSLSLLRLRQERFCVSAETVALVYRLMTLTEQTDDQLNSASNRFSYGFCLLWHGDTSAAIAQFQIALKGGEATGNIPLQDRCLAYLAVAYRRLGDQAQVKFYTERNLIVAQTEQRSAYLGVARASQAWLYFCEGDWAATMTEGQSALQLWTHGNVYPFQWLVYWPLFAIALASGRLADTVGAARAMLGPDQQQLPQPLLDSLQAAIAAWEQQQPLATTTHLQQALQLARDGKYL